MCKIYEEHLKRLNPSSPQITYDISQVFFIKKLLKNINKIKAVRLHRRAGRSVVPGVPEELADLSAVQQGLGQGEDLHFVA